MRMRRKKWARPELDACDFFLKEPTSNKNKWNQSFKNNAPIHLELGCGKGTFISELASQNKEFNFIGIDLISDIQAVADQCSTRTGIDITAVRKNRSKEKTKRRLEH